jgi:hypothetical protein
LKDKVSSILDFSDDDRDNLHNNIINHDKSKFNKDEFDAYANYFYAEERKDEYRTEFYDANRLHKTRNPHHYEYWQNDNGIVENMPNIYILEMVCDWLSFAYMEERVEEIFEWYDLHKPNLNFSDNLFNKVEAILDIIKKENN